LAAANCLELLAAALAFFTLIAKNMPRQCPLSSVAAS
jgi:hypothetical protein